MTHFPNPMGCAVCGIDRRGHSRQHTETGGWHTWKQPSQQQIKDRMRARRATRLFVASVREGVNEWKAEGVASAETTLRELENQLYAEDPSDRADAYYALQASGYLDESAIASATQCPSCGPTTPEPHPRLPIKRCSNRKEHEHDLHVSKHPPSAGDLIAWVSNGIEQKKAAVERGMRPENWLWPLANDPNSILRRCAADRHLLDLHGGRGHSCPAYDSDGDLDEHTRFSDNEICPVLEQLAVGYGWPRAGDQIECG
jgi:hypothetical protein